MSLFHRRMGHSGQPTIQRLLSRNMTIGIQVARSSGILPCDDCVADLAGPVRPKSLGGTSYILNLFDIYTRYSWNFVLKTKAKTSVKIREWLSVAERQAGTKLKGFRSDNGGEFLPLASQSWLKFQGVTQKTTPSRSRESNGLAERLNCTLEDKVQVHDGGRKSAWLLVG